MGKGSQRRPSCITPKAEQLQWDLAFGHISKDEYWKQRKILENQGKWWKQ